VQEAQDYLAGTYGFTNPLTSGALADEFGGSEPLCAIYAEAARRLKATNKDQFYYPFGRNICNGPEGLDMMKALMETGGVLAWERYQKEQASEIETLRFLNRKLVQPIRNFEQKCPGSPKNISVVFGYFSCPNETLDTYPNIDYRTYLDMQFNLVARHPDFKNIGGLMTYLSRYCDEEIVRWGAALMRHYAIEGKTDMLTKDPLVLRHITDGDFEQHGAGWHLSPAEAGSIDFGAFGGLGNLEGRWPNPREGDTVVILKRSAARPNVISQEIKGLTPGRLYSFEMISGNYPDLHTQGKHALNIRIEGASLVPEKCFTSVFHHCYSHNFGPYTTDNWAWMNYHWRVFRATAKTAKLTISDWPDEQTPGGPIGQQLMMNFVQVEPYFGE
jgi:hypothetical protein